MITIYHTKLPNVFKWLEQELGLKIGHDWHWTWNRAQDRPGIEFVDPQTELLVQLKAKDL